MNLSISLTSIGSRLETLPKVLRSLLNQTVKPARIMVYLSKEPFPQGIDKGCKMPLPRSLQILFATEPLLHIRWVSNHGSYRKLVPFVQEFPNELVLTVDDDILYDPKLVESALGLWTKYKACISFNCTVFKKNTPYLMWPGAQPNSESVDYFAKGNAGVLYHTSWFQDPRFADAANFLTLAPLADDVWFNFWRMALNIPVYYSTTKTRTQQIGTKTSLFEFNNTKNDAQIELVSEYLSQQGFSLLSIDSE
jgi:hypothetical protein